MLDVKIISVISDNFSEGSTITVAKRSFSFLTISITRPTFIAGRNRPASPDVIIKSPSCISESLGKKDISNSLLSDPPLTITGFPVLAKIAGTLLLISEINRTLLVN